MSKTIKYIIIGLVVAAVLFLLIYFVFSGGTPGSLIAALTGGWAAFKSKAFSAKDLEEKIEGIETEHSVKRDEWQRIQEEYESKFKAMQARMDYLDYRSMKIREQIGNLDQQEKEQLKELDNMSLEEKLNLLNKI